MDGRVFSQPQPMNSNGNAMASTSSTNFPDHISASYANSVGPQPHMIQGQLPQSQWHGMMPQNAHLSNQQPQLQAYTSWPPQMHPQGVPNGTSAATQHPVHQNQQNMSGFNNLGFFPAQILQDALRMSAPVGSVPGDDNLLAQALHNSTKNGQTYRQAMEALHGTHNHAANLWKDYYLDHKPRIDKLVFLLTSRSERTTKKPTPPTHISQPAPERRSSSQKRRASSSQNVVRRQATSGTRRSTINSLTTPTPVYDAHLPPPHADIIVPLPPSRSPTPPTDIVPGINGNRYTPKDKKYFIDFISWRLKCDPTLTKSELTEKLAEKAPHHSAQSWSSHWHSQHDLADKILAAAKGDSDESQEESSEEEIIPPRKVRYKESSRSGSGASSATSASSADDDSDADDLSLDERTSDDENNMGPARGPYTKADLRLAAKYIASRYNWLDLNHRDRWVPFSAKYPQRSDKSWGEYYRKNERKIDRLAQKYKAREETGTTVRVQRGRPTWANSRSNPPKRKYLPDGSKGHTLGRVKRARADSDDDADGEVDEDV